MDLNKNFDCSKTFIYCLCLDKIPFYIGKSNYPKKRIGEHKSKLKQNIEGFILDEVENIKQVWKFWESFYIQLFRSWGFNLINQNNGGGGPISRSLETRIKISRSTTGKPKPWLKGIKFTEERKQNISKANKGHIVTEETKLKISKSKLGLKVSEETKNKKRLSMVGKNKGQKRNEEFKKKLSKPIIQLDLNGNFIKQWSSTSEANKTIKGDIFACLKNKNKTAGGYKWKYLN